MKRILDYNHTSLNMLVTFFPTMDMLENDTRGIYDTIICSRDGIQNNFEDILKYTHKNTKIIVDIITESGCIEDFLQFFDQLTRKYSNILFYLMVDSEFDYDFQPNVRTCASFKLSPLAFFENFSQENHNHQHKIRFPEVYEKQNGFCCLNGRARSHRLLLLLEFLKRNWVNLNQDNLSQSISFLFYTNTNTIDYETYTSLVNELNIPDDDKLLLLNMSTRLPIKLPHDGENFPNLLLHGNFAKQIINLVTENVAGIDCGINDTNKITFTEKAWIPFKIHQIPIYISVPGYVEQLRKLGFDLFDDVVDHSYDKEPDVSNRIKMAVDQLEIISKMDLLDFYNKNYTRFIKNDINCESLKMEGYFIFRDFILENDLL